MTEYFDIRCGDDLDPFARDVDPLEALAQDLYHLLITDRGALFMDPDWGFGLENYLNRPLPGTLATDIENVVRADDRVSNARCTIAPTGAPNSYRLDLQVEVEGSFLDIALAMTPDGVARL